MSFLRIFILIIVFSIILCPSETFAQNKEIPIIIEDSGSDSGTTDDSGKKVEIVQNVEKEVKKIVPQVKKSRKTAKTLRRGSSINKLIRTFKKYRTDADFDEMYFDENNDNFSKKQSNNLKNDLIKWKKMRIRAKGLKRKNDPRFEDEYKKIKDFEQNVITKYGPQEQAVEIQPETPETIEVAENSTGIEAETETGKMLLKELMTRTKDDVTDTAVDIDEDVKREKETAHKRMKKIRKERQGRRHHKSNLRISPRRVCYNKIPPARSAMATFVIRNKSKEVFEGAIVPIEDWITVSPPTIYLEPRTEIEIDITIKAPDRKKARIEGSVEIRAVGESSRRLPVVVRTSRR